MELNPFDNQTTTYSQYTLNTSEVNEQNRHIDSRLREFLRTFSKPGERDLMTGYRDRLSHNYNQGKYSIEVDYQDLLHFDETLTEELRKSPDQLLPRFEKAAKDVLTLSMLRPEDDSRTRKIPDIQVQLKNYTRNDESLRTLGAEHVSKLVSLPGIIISASRVRPKAVALHLRCRNCGAVKIIENKGGFGAIKVPRQCTAVQSNQMSTEKCPLDPFEQVADKCIYRDTQRLKLQERPEDVPTGEMPRHLSLYIDREFVDKIQPGTRVRMIGVYSIIAQKKQQQKRGGKTAESVRQPYLRVVGVETLNATEVKGSFSPEEEEEIRKLGTRENIYEDITKSIAPNIFGNEDVKKAVACLMFGGTRKHLLGGTKLRGDINVLLLGDPSVAKSQFLKYVHQVAPIGVYTSGKGSSAAGLTASVLRDPGSGEFHLEGGAMVLADGGVVCIDEFDKMREDDRISIHEAMEQQTISIAKAGITTTLNSRCSVLAAANPIYGRYDDMRTVSENIDFQTTILSRFDLIFILRDVKDIEQDKNLAQHIMDFHINVNASRATTDAPISAEDMSKLVAYARKYVKPQLSEDAAESLKNHYITFRQTAKQREEETGMQSTIPITVRQLEAIIRISESLAKMELSEEATQKHVTEAVRLFRFATMRAVQQGSLVGENILDGNSQFVKNVQKAEEVFRTRVAVGSTSNVKNVVKHIKERGLDEHAIIQALHFMFLRSEIEYYSGRRMLRRIR